MNKWIVAVIIVVVIGGLYWWSRPPSYDPRTSDTDNFRGSGVEVVEFSDFECPACQRAFPEVEEALTNLSVKFVYKHFPLTQIHARAMAAAEASECAADQGKFWEYYERLFVSRKLAAEDFIAHAKVLGLDVDAFRVCVKSHAMQQRVLADQQEGIGRGVRATPTFFINGKKYEGVLAADKLRAIIGASS